MKRELTTFFARELLPAYLEGALDKSRKTAVDVALSKDAKIKSDLDSMREQIEFLENLGTLEPSKELVSFLETRPSGIQNLKIKLAWSKWSNTTQWASQLAVVGLLLLLSVHFFPWLNLARSIKTIKPKVPQLANITGEQEPLRTRAIYGPFWPKEFPSPDAYAAQAEERLKKNAAIADIVTRTDEENSGSQIDEEVEGAAKQQGYVWRGTLKVPELDDTTARQVTEQIERLGGTKAGQVELGWKKGNTRYYHFTLPLSNYTPFQEQMTSIGSMNLTKEKHPRVMKDDVMRIIMSVEGGN